MEDKERIYIATWALAKGLDFEKMKYSDALYGKESEAESCWEFAKEAIAIGRIKFREKYKGQCSPIF